MSLLTQHGASSPHIGQVLDLPAEPSDGFCKPLGASLTRASYSELNSNFNLLGSNFACAKPWVYQYELNSVQVGDIGGWTTATSLLEVNRLSQALVTKDRVYLLGGVNAAATAISTVYTAPINADGTIGTWTTGTSLPGALYNSQVVVTKNRVYLLGGYTTTTVGIVYTAPINSDGTLGTWTTGTSLPGPLSGSQAITTTNRVYLLGGQLSSVVYTAPINSDGTLGTWTTGTSLPAARGFSSVAVTKNKVYLVGGADSAGVSMTSIISAPINSDGSLGTWVDAGSISLAPTYAQAVVTKGCMYLIGNGLNTYYAPIDSNGTLGSWSTGSSFPSNAYQGSLITTSSRIYFMGGRIATGVNTVYSASFSGGFNNPMDKTMDITTLQLGTASTGKYAKVKNSLLPVVDCNPLGTIVTMLDTPTDGSYLPTGNVISRSAYPELSAKFPFPKLPDVTNGSPWTGSAVAINVGSLAYGSGIFVGANNANSSTYITSTDAVTWTSRTLPISGTFSHVAYGNSTFVLVTSASDTRALTSTDGLTWVQRTLPVATTHSRIIYGNKFVVSTSGSSILSSTDGVTWSSVTIAGATNNCVAHLSGTYCSVGPSQSAYTSTDAITWVTRTMSANRGWQKIYTGYNCFIAISNEGNVPTHGYSTDGITWVDKAFPSNVTEAIVFYGNNLCIAYDSSSTKYFYSTDSLSWSTSNLPTYGYTYYPLYAVNKFVLIGVNIVATAPAADSSKMKLGTAITNEYVRVK